MTLPNPTSRLERNYFSGFFSDERHPVIIRELGDNGEVLDEELDYREGHPQHPRSGCRYMPLEDGGYVNIDAAYNDPERYQPPNEWNSRQAREDWYARYRNATP